MPAPVWVAVVRAVIRDGLFGGARRRQSRGYEPLATCYQLFDEKNSASFA